MKRGVRFAHEEHLHDDDDDYEEDEDEEDQGLSVTTGSECSSVSDEPVLFFANDDEAQEVCWTIQSNLSC